MKKLLLNGLGTLAVVGFFAAAAIAATPPAAGSTPAAGNAKGGAMTSGESTTAPAMKVIDPTSATLGWKLETDQTATKELALTDGPKPGTKALQVTYEFKDSAWIALIKEMGYSLGQGQGLRFWYTGTGATVNLMVKVFDANGNAAGFTVPDGTVTTGWKPVVIPQSAFEYLWGPNPAKTVNFDSLTKLEFTLDTAERSGMAYQMSKAAPGKISISSIELVNTGAGK